MAPPLTTQAKKSYIVGGLGESVKQITCIELRRVGHRLWKLALCIDRLPNELRVEGRPRVDYEH